MLTINECSAIRTSKSFVPVFSCSDHDWRITVKFVHMFACLTPSFLVLLKDLIYLSLRLALWLFGAVIHEPSGPTPDSQFEHSSIPATVKKLFKLKSNFLTKRDAWAGTFENYFKLRQTPRDDCPGLNHPIVFVYLCSTLLS